MVAFVRIESIWLRKHKYLLSGSLQKKFVHPIPILSTDLKFPLNNWKNKIQVIYYIMSALWILCFKTSPMISVQGKCGLYQEILSWQNTYWTELIYWEESCNGSKLVFLDEFLCWPHSCHLGWCLQGLGLSIALCARLSKYLMWIRTSQMDSGAPEVAFLSLVQYQGLVSFMDGAFYHFGWSVGWSYFLFFLSHNYLDCRTNLGFVNCTSEEFELWPQREE